MLKRLLFWLSWPGLFVYFRCSRRARVALIDEDHILLVKDRFLLWFGQDQWVLPGGGLHRLETPAAGAVRELREELGLDLDVPQLTLLGSGWVGSYGLQYRASFLAAHISRTIPLQLKTSEIAVAEWCEIKMLNPDALKPEVHEALRLLQTS